MATRTLWGLGYSPWTEKARWALDHHGLDYDYREHMPLLGEPGLRWRSRKRTPGTPASVPMLLDGATVLGDSTLIARHAETLGSRAPLFGAEHEAAIEGWIRKSDDALAAVRILVVAATLRSPEAQAENLPLYVPGALRPAMRPMARFGSNFILRKYGSELDEAAATTKVCAFLDELEGMLDGEYLLGEFSYADMTAAMVVNGIAPLRERFFASKPAIAETWDRPELAKRYAALVDWRDTVYSKHRASG